MGEVVQAHCPICGGYASIHERLMMCMGDCGMQMYSGKHEFDQFYDRLRAHFGGVKRAVHEVLQQSSNGANET